MNENDRTVDLEDLEELSPGIDDLSLFNAKDSNGNHRFNAPIPFGMAPELEFIIEDFLPSGILGMVVATGGSGKTMFLTQLAYCVASGREFMGMRTVDPRKVLYVYAEETNEEIHRRLDRIRDHHGDSGDCENLDRLCGYGMDLRFEEEEKDERIKDQLGKYIARFDPGLVILDPTAHFSCAENENDSVQTNKFVRMLRTLTRSGTTVLIAHHTSKFGSNQSDQHSSRGSSALTDGARWVLNMTGYDSTRRWEKELEEIDQNELWKYKIAEITKVNNFMPRDRIMYLRMEGSGIITRGPEEECMLTESQDNRNTGRGVRRRAA